MIWISLIEIHDESSICFKIFSFISDPPWQGGQRGWRSNNQGCSGPLTLQDWDEYLKHNQEYILNDKHLNNRKPKPSKILLSLHCAYNFIIVLMKDSKVLWLRDLFFIFCANCISLSVVPESNGPVQVSKEEKNEK